jgi:hypothetical protein
MGGGAPRASARSCVVARVLARHTHRASPAWSRSSLATTARARATRQKRYASDALVRRATHPRQRAANRTPSAKTGSMVAASTLVGIRRRGRPIGATTSLAPRRLPSRGLDASTTRASKTPTADPIVGARAHRTKSVIETHASRSTTALRTQRVAPTASVNAVVAARPTRVSLAIAARTPTAPATRAKPVRQVRSARRIKTRVTRLCDARTSPSRPTAARSS